MARNAYVIPIAKHGFVKVDSEDNPIRYGLEDENGFILTVKGRLSWPSLLEAVKAGRDAGYSLPEEPNDEPPSKG
jgi:hypothetical protein